MTHTYVEKAVTALETLPRRDEKISGQTFQYVQLEEAVAAVTAALAQIGAKP